MSTDIVEPTIEPKVQASRLAKAIFSLFDVDNSGEIGVLKFYGGINRIYGSAMAYSMILQISMMYPPTFDQCLQFIQIVSPYSNTLKLEDFEKVIAHTHK